MRTLLSASFAVYSITLLFFVAVLVEMVRAIRRGDLERVDFRVGLFAAGGGVMICMHNFLSKQFLTGNFVCDVALCISPLFMARMSKKYVKVSVLPSVAVFLLLVFGIFGYSFCLPLMQRWRSFLPLVVLTLQGLCLGGILWKMTGFERRLTGVSTLSEVLNVIVDIFYFIFLLFLMCAGVFIGGDPGWGSAVPAFVCVVMMLALMLAQRRRDKSRRMFVFNEEREKKFLELQRICVGGADAIDNACMYENLFLRLRAYFENENPFLDPDLSLEAVAKSLMTNKMYLSRTVNLYTGRNFCQYVNYHRIRYAVSLYKKNPTHKVVDLSILSGFHTVHSFTMAFRLYMNMSPGEWCKANRPGGG